MRRDGALRTATRVYDNRGNAVPSPAGKKTYFSSPVRPYQLSRTLSLPEEMGFHPRQGKRHISLLQYVHTSSGEH